MTFWASGSTDKTPNDNTRLWSNFWHCVFSCLLSILHLFPSITVQLSENDRLAGEPSLYCRWRGFVWMRWPCSVFLCVLKSVYGVHELGDTEQGLAWPRLRLSVVQSQRRSEAGKVWAFRNTEGVRGQRGRSKSIMDTTSRCHSKWLFLGGSMCANIDWRACVCLCIISGRKKEKMEQSWSSESIRGSVVWNWILYLRYCCCLCLGGQDGQIFFSNAVLHYKIYFQFL